MQAQWRRRLLLTDNTVMTLARKQWAPQNRIKSFPSGRAGGAPELDCPLPVCGKNSRLATTTSHSSYCCH